MPAGMERRGEGAAFAGDASIAGEGMLPVVEPKANLRPFAGEGEGSDIAGAVAVGAPKLAAGSDGVADGVGAASDVESGASRVNE